MAASERGRHNFKWRANTWHTLIITTDSDIGLTSY